MNNDFVPMTRRYPKLAQKVLIRDSKISERLIKAWDVDHNHAKVLEIFVKEKKNLSDERYWELLRTVWILCGCNEDAEMFRQLMKSGRGQRYYFSTPEESAELRDMPDVLQVYRATNDSNDNGLSWTLSKEYAEWYKEAYCKDTIISRQIKKGQVFAYINRNKESEIILL